MPQALPLEKSVILADAPATKNFAASLAQACLDLDAAQKGLVIYLEGDLGAGKTTFSQGFIQHFLPDARVKSPTYTLVEEYSFADLNIYHFDLYRMCDPEELEYLGFREMLQPPYIFLVEWPSKGVGVVPQADLTISLEMYDLARQLNLVVHNQEFNKLLSFLSEK